MLQRRRFIQGVGATGLAPLAVVLANPELAAAAAATLEPVQTTTKHGPVRAALARPAESRAPAVLLIHEWWGLNDQIKSVAADFAAQGYLGLAIDLYGGEVATTPDRAQALTKTVDQAVATDTLVTWARWLKSNPASTGKLGVIGWCFGGGWSLALSLAEPVDATVIYYGRCTQSATELKALKGPVLGHFGTQDKFITVAMVEGFKAALTEADKPAEIYFYDANHAFANPTGANYDQKDAALAWQRTTAFLAKQLKG
jgi:carboxymethylenebutenolidase